MNTLKDKMTHFTACQTVANEIMIASKDELIKEAEIRLSEKLGAVVNRSQKKKKKEIIDKQLESLGKVIEKYISTTNKMINHIYDSDCENMVDEKVESIYKFLE